MGLMPQGLASRYAVFEPYGFIIVIAFIGLGVFNILIEPVVRPMLAWLLI
jgi:hypothetical protein